MSSNYFVDLHCHSTLKPYGRSFPDNQNSSDPTKTSSIWHSVNPGIWAKIKNIILSITQFTQADFSTLLKARVIIIGTSISPIEKGFFVSGVGDGKTVSAVANIVAGVGKPKIEFIKHNFNYFSELMNEYNFLLQLNNQTIYINGESCKYVVVNHFSQIESNISEKNVLLVIPSIEGSHVFCDNNNQRSEDQPILVNVEKVKKLEYPPLFISLAHHFYNELAGHAYSLSKGLQKFLKQDFGANTSITGLGLKVVDLLLDKTKGKRILIDIKHMSRLVRRQYYDILKSPEYMGQDIPLIVSHGAVNGRPTVYSDEEHGSDNGLFHGGDINFYDDELVLIARSKGIFGIQLDERRAAGKNNLKKIRFKLNRKKMLNAQSDLLWNQIEHIAIVLDKAGLASWNTVTIGSDYDGGVDPLNGFWTAAEYPMLARYLLKHAQIFYNSPENILSDNNRNIDPQEIIRKIFSENAYEFLKRNLQ